MDKSLKTKWGKFLGVVLGPGSVIFSLLTLVSLILAFAFKTNTLFATLLTVLGSIFAGIAGSFIKDDYNRLATDNVLEKKGLSAIRNLSSIGQQVILIRGWIKSFISEKNITKKEIKRELEEIDRHINMMEGNINSGLQDWKDIVPELKETEEVTRVYESVIKKYFEELLKNKKELLEVGENKELKERLEKRIKELEKNVKELKNEQPHIFSGGSVGSSFAISADPFMSAGGNVRFIGSNNKICSECGRTYYKDDLTAVSVFDRNICPDCKKKYNF